MSWPETTFDADENDEMLNEFGAGAGPPGAELPVGTVLAFAGRFANGLQSQGWWSCEGQPMSTTDFGELFAAIGFAFGQPAPDQFNLPDLRGWFVRGTGTSGSAEVGAAAADRRQPPTLAAASGDTTPVVHGVGSSQSYGTAPPRNPFVVDIPNYNIVSGSDDSGCASRPGAFVGSTITLPAAGGDLESRPVNKYVSYLIKVASTVTSTDSSADTTTVAMPVGALVPFAGQMGASAPGAPVWRICNGDPVAVIEAGELFESLKFIHGGVDAQHFVLPDYRGWFHRGVTGVSGADPEATKRTAPYPAGAAAGYAGNDGNQVGSVQPAATGAATSTPLLTVVSNIPTTDAGKRVAGDLWDLIQRQTGSQLTALTTGGGDAETRPDNVSVDWYVLSSVGPDANPLVPVGGVAAMGCTLADNAWWLLCDGSLVQVADFGALYAAIGNTYGGTSGSTFMLPDYRTKFLRGAAYSTTQDPNVAERAVNPGGSVPTGGVGTSQGWATGRPVNPFTSSIPGLPASLLGAHGITVDNNTRDGGTLALATCTEGGDSETRPRNVYLNFYIRAK